jgi:hypothetical protein
MRGSFKLLQTVPGVLQQEFTSRVDLSCGLQPGSQSMYPPLLQHWVPRVLLPDVEVLVIS